MPISHDFEYAKPKTINEILDLLDKKSETAKIIAGGTDLTVYIKENVIAPELVIDIKGIPDFNKIEFKDNKLYLGAGITFSEIEESTEIKERLKILWEAACTVASVGIRNRATLVGNICSAVPSLDSAPALMVYDTLVHVKSKTEERTISIHDWFVAPKKTALKSNELVTGITLNLPEEKNASCYKKLGRYSGEDLAQAGVGVLMSENNTSRISFCAVGPVPVRARKIEEYLNEKEISDVTIKEAQKLVDWEISPITDIRASKEYRMHMAKIMLERALLETDAVLKGEDENSNPII